MLRPAWGYVDQPPLTPLLARGFSAVFADATWAIRHPGDAGHDDVRRGRRADDPRVRRGTGAQALAAWGYAFAALPLIIGHALLTSTIDLPVWPAVRAVRRARRAARPSRSGGWRPAWSSGVSMYNKLLVAVLLVALAAGVLLVGPRRLLSRAGCSVPARSRCVVGAPNLIYQATHGWPQLKMGRALADNNAGDVHCSCGRSCS